MEVANALNADLEVIVARTLALPVVPEGGLGAVADDGTSILNEEIIQKAGISHEQIEYESEKVKAQVKERSLKYLGKSPRPRLTGKVAIIVDDGLASGITMTVAVESVKHRRPKEIVVAVPVASATGFKRAAGVADKVVTCAVATMPKFYLADFYRTWQDIGDEGIAHSLKQWRQRHNL